MKNYIGRIPHSPLYPVECSTVAGFEQKQPMSAKLVPRFNLYRPPVLVKGKRWYVEYYYKVPPELISTYGQWHRVRVFMKLNKIKTDEYAEWVIATVTDALDNGFSPFGYEKELVVKKKVAPKWSLDYGLDQFIQEKRSNELRVKSIQTYQVTADALKVYFAPRLYERLDEFTSDDIERFLADWKIKNKLSNSTRNNYLNFINTIFNWFVSKKVIRDNPAKGLKKLKVNISKHKYYSNEVLTKLQAVLKKEDPQLFQFCQFIYYTATRPAAEARKLQVKHILWERELLFVPGHISKNRKDDYIPMSEGLIDMLKEMTKGVGEDAYLFGKDGKPGKVMADERRLQERFKAIRDKLKLDSDYTIYSWKHTRGLHLAEDGASPYDIMKLFRHSSLDMTMKYLRDLGISSDNINKATRKI